MDSSSLSEKEMREVFETKKVFYSREIEKLKTIWIELEKKMIITKDETEMRKTSLQIEILNAKIEKYTLEYKLLTKESELYDKSIQDSSSFLAKYATERFAEPTPKPLTVFPKNILTLAPSNAFRDEKMNSKCYAIAKSFVYMPPMHNSKEVINKIVSETKKISVLENFKNLQETIIRTAYTEIKSGKDVKTNKEKIITSYGLLHNIQIQKFIPMLSTEIKKIYLEITIN